MTKIWAAINLAQDHKWSIPLASLLPQALVFYNFSPIAHDRSSGETWEVTQKNDIYSSTHLIYCLCHLPCNHVKKVNWICWVWCQLRKKYIYIPSTRVRCTEKLYLNKPGEVLDDVPNAEGSRYGISVDKTPNTVAERICHQMNLWWKKMLCVK